jgi:hemolysin activation/secretion protein
MLCLPGVGFAADALNSTVIQNSTSYGATELFDIYKAHLGRPVTEHTAKSIAEAVQQKYVDDGFTRPGYRILDAGIGNGIIRIKLIEATVSRVSISGETGPYRQKLEALFSGLPSAGSIRPDQIRDSLRRARRLPGLGVAVSTEPDPAVPAAFVLNLEADYSPAEANIKLSNRGTREIGRELLFGRVTGHGLFGFDNSSGVFFASASDHRKYSSGGLYTILALGDDGANARIQGSHTSIHITSDGIPLDQTRDLYSMKLSRPVSGSLIGDATLWGAFAVDNLDVRQDSVISREDRLRSVELGMITSRRGNAAIAQLSVEIEQGLGMFGARRDILSNPAESRDPGFTIVRMHYLKSSRINELWTLRWDGYAQYSAHELASIKRFKVGGDRIGRGFEAAAVSGDRGLAAKVELRRRLSDEPNWRGNASTYGFYDLGAAWKNDIRGRESAASTGFGVSLRGQRLSGYLELATPLTHTDADGRKDAGIFAEVSLQF